MKNVEEIVIVSLGSLVILVYLCHVLVKVRERKNMVQNNLKYFGIWEFQALIIGGLITLFSLIGTVIEWKKTQDLGDSFSLLFVSFIGLIFFLAPFLSIERKKKNKEVDYVCCSVCNFEQWIGYDRCQKCGAKFPGE